MFNQIEAGKVFELKNEATYEKGKAVKTPFIQDGSVSMLIIAMDHAQLPEHPAPADALITVLEGEGELTYAGNRVHLKEHDSFRFDKGAIHSVTTDHKLKFSLLLLG